MRTASRFRLLMFAVALSWSGPALAQGLFESLFGGGQSQRHTAPAPGPRQSLPPPVQPAFGYRTPTYNPFRTPGPREADDQSAQQSRSGSYRTMCVRMCDGFYWPISHNVARSSFYRDANACRASCGEDAKLFFHAASEGDAGQMVDLQGRAYAKLSTAFRYRKTQIAGCRCKPEPWMASEMSRHQLYALNETTEERQRRLARFAHVMTPTGPVLGFEGPIVLTAATIGQGAARSIASGEASIDAPAAVAVAEPDPQRGRKPRADRVVDRAVAPPREQFQRASLTKPAPSPAPVPRGQVYPQPPQAQPQPKGFFGGGFGGGGGSRWPGDR